MLKCNQVNADYGEGSVTITVAQLGCGYWGPNLLRNFSAQSDCWVKWLADLSPQRRSYVEANYPKTKTTANWEDVMADPEVDAVVVATPASTHYKLAKVALEAGKHVLVEKPLAMCTTEADELVALAEATGRTLMVGHTFLYNAAVRHLKQLLDKGELGELYYIYSQRLNLGQVRSDVNAWWNLAPHDVSILLYLMDGELPVSVSAYGMDYIQAGIEDVVFATLTWANRVTAHIQVSWLDPGKVRKMTLVSSRKMLVYDDVSDDKLTILDKGIDRIPKAGESMDYDNFNNYQLFHRAGDIWLPKINFQEPLKTEVAHFLDCIRLQGQSPLTGGKQGRDVVAILEAGQHSIKNNGKPITL
nr:Gfo/Idh/MocA family oxidoreductase [Microcoleus sp. FACHB-68]